MVIGVCGSISGKNGDGVDGDNGDGDRGIVGRDGESTVMVMVKCEKQHTRR